ncbi:MAG: DUF1980 domain-containing protein [Chthoniobacteraceae bacterium]
MTTALFNRWLPCLTLAAWSAILLTFHFTGDMKSFLIPMFRQYAFIAGIVLGLMALVFLFFKADTSCCSMADCGHSLSRFATGKLLTFLVLILPISVAALFSPDSFGKTAIENRGVITDAAALGGAPKISAQPVPMPLPTKGGQPPASATGGAAGTAAAAEPSPTDYLERTPEGNIVTEVLDLLYAAQDNILRQDFEGKRIQLIGQFMPASGKDGGPSRFKAVRMFMTCCAADSRPVATLVEVDQMPDVPEMTWVRIVGTSKFPIEKGRRISILKADTVEKTAPPEETMLY